MILIKSIITKKLLNYFFINPQESLYVNELSRKLQLEKRNLVKKLRELENEGILKSRSEGNLKLYSLNPNYPLYEEYKKIVMKTTGFEETLKKVILRINEVKEVYIYGSYAKDTMDTHSDIDLLVIGNHSIIELQHELNKLQKELKREINIVNMDGKEFKKRINKKDPFIRSVIKQKHIRII